MKNTMDLKVWLLDDHAGNFSGAQIASVKPVTTKQMWKTLISQFADLTNDVICPSGSTEGIYIISSNDRIVDGITDMLITRASFDRALELHKIQLPGDTIGLVFLTAESDHKLGVISLNYRVFPSKGSESFLFGVPVKAKVTPIKISSYTKTTLGYISTKLEEAVAKV